jgi:diketogulonate reductase-like aldo/keto reductase
MMNPQWSIVEYGTGTSWSETSGASDINRGLVDSIKSAIKPGYHHLDDADIYEEYK